MINTTNHHQIKAMKTQLFLAMLLSMLTIVGMGEKRPGHPARVSLNDSLVAKDSLLYDAIFHTSNLALVEGTLDKNFVFRQDQGYTTPTKTQTRDEYMAGVKGLYDQKSKGQAPAMRRELVKASVQLFPGDPNHATQTGTQHFYITEAGKPEQLVEESKFIRDWKREKDGQWRITSELDFLYNPHPGNAAAAALAPAASSAPVFTDALTAQVFRLDSLLFTAFNRQDLETMKTLFTPDLEFFHDRDGLGDYAKTVGNFRSLFERNKTSPISRELVPASLQVYPIKGFGAIQLGEHRFCHLENGQPDCGNFKFVHIWKKEGDQWRICRVISYGHVATSDTTGSLYQTVAGLDKTLFDSFNNRRLDSMKSSFAVNLEFYQDNEGLENYDRTMSDFSDMFSDSDNAGLRRELVQGTLEVYPLPGYGAIEVGQHRFVHKENGVDVAGTFHFVHVWQQTGDRWKLTRIISFGH